MGRRRRGPRQLKPGGPFCAVLHVPQNLRDRVGKVRLIRSLQTADHSEALKRYGEALRRLEKELEGLSSPQTLRSHTEASREAEVRTGDAPLTAVELTEIQLGSFNPQDSTHRIVYEAHLSGQPTPITWSEAIDVWIKESNRSRAEPLAEGTIHKYREAVKFFEPYAQPHEVTKQIIRQFLEDHEEDYSPNTVSNRKSWLGAIFQALVQTDKVSISNPFRDVKYTAVTRIEDQKRPFTDEEIRVIHKHHPEIYLMLLTGLRPGEYFSRYDDDLNGRILRIDKQPSRNWRPKTHSSYRDVPVPEGFTIFNHKTLVQSQISFVGRQLRKDIEDPTATPHSARHTFYTLSRRAECNDAVIEAITGHAKKEGSRVAQKYGLFPDEVLIREASKVWNLVNSLVKT